MGDVSTLIGIVAGLSVAIFVYSVFSVFAKGWQTYEDNYLEGTEKTLDAMFLSMPAQHLLYLSISSFFVFGLLGLLISGMLYVAVPIGLIFFFAPKLCLVLLKNFRDKKFLEQLPNAVMSMSNSLKAGFSLIQSFDRITVEMSNPIAQEFRLMLYEIRLGKTVEESLNNLLKRMPSQDLDIFVNAIQMSMEVGGNISEIFDKIAETIRERNRIEGKIKALTAQGKMQGVVISLMPVAFLLLMYFVKPAMVMAFLAHPIGLMMLGAALLMIIVGYFFIKKIVTIQV